MSKGLFVFMLFIGLVACGQREGLAPVVERKWVSINPNATKHTVVSGETLFAIAFRYDSDYRKLAQINNLKKPYSLRVGQILRLPNKHSSKSFYSPKLAQKNISYHQKQLSPLPSTGQSWQWPAHGKVMTRFEPTYGRKGINIAGNRGDKIYAAADGVVAYAGNGLLGYGNLIIIKQGNHYLTAYGNNAKNLVNEGQKVRQGQVIAYMGIIDRKYSGLHFEIRKMGQPVNPLLYLKGYSK